MLNLTRANSALHRMARALDGMSRELNVRNLASGRYERATNEYQDRLLDAYDKWMRRLKRELGDTADVENVSNTIQQLMPALTAELQIVAQAGMPGAVQAMSGAYVPSPDAYRMIADAVTRNNQDIETSLIPAIQDKLLNAVVEGKPIGDAAETMTARVVSYAGNFWALIQRFVGDFALQAQAADDVIYRCRWVSELDEATCDACKAYAGEYDSYNAMLEQTSQSVPGYFFNAPYRSCWTNCRCHLELFVEGRWQRV